MWMWHQKHQQFKAEHIRNDVIAKVDLTSMHTHTHKPSISLIDLMVNADTGMAETGS